jgi:hypothetical protein
MKKKNLFPTQEEIFKIEEEEIELTKFEKGKMLTSLIKFSELDLDFKIDILNKVKKEVGNLDDFDFFLKDSKI